MTHRINMSAALGAIASAVAFPSAAAATTVVAQWDMGDTFGNVMTDSSGNNNNGTTYNIGTSGTGYVFDGGTSKVIVPDSPTLNPGTADFTYSVQIQTNVIPPKARDYDLLRKGLSPTAGGEYKIELVYGAGLAKAQCVAKDANGHEGGIRGTQNLADGQLHTITCKKTATGVTMIVDGGRARKKAVTLGSISNTADLLIGVKQPDSPENDLKDGDWYNGYMESATISVEP
jgi:Concanavalin A-like lectin/glucanases superfamily